MEEDNQFVRFQGDGADNIGIEDGVPENINDLERAANGAQQPQLRR